MVRWAKILFACVMAGSVLTACTAASTQSKDGSKAIVTKASDKKSGKKPATKTAKANVKKTRVKNVNTALSQRPSEIIVSVNGKVTRTGEVYLLRGLANVFSRGMDTLGAKMVRSGLDARVYNHAAWRSLADNIIKRKKKKQVSYPIVIMGHSLGANATMQMANYLGKNGVRVSYAVGFDPTITTSVGKNVSRVINFYIPNKNHTNVVKKAAGFRGTMKNVNIEGKRALTHMNIEKDRNLQSQVLRRTLSYTKKKRRRS